MSSDYNVPMPKLWPIGIIALLLQGLATAGGAEAQGAVPVVRAALAKGDLAEARRLALVAVDQALADLPPCGVVSGLGNPSQFAFPAGEAERVYIQRYGLLGYYDLRSGRVRRVWQAGLGNGHDIPASNAFSRFFAKSGRLSVEFQCGKQPQDSRNLTLFEVVAPPGVTTAGRLSATGKFSPILKKDFNTVNPPKGKTIYQQWIINLPKE